MTGEGGGRRQYRQSNVSSKPDRRRSICSPPWCESSLRQLSPRGMRTLRDLGIRDNRASERRLRHPALYDLGRAQRAAGHGACDGPESLVTVSGSTPRASARRSFFLEKQAAMPAVSVIVVS